MNPTLIGNRIQKRLTTIALASLLLCGSAVVALPSAAAHDCTSGNPAQECGPCPAGENHNHRYPDSQHHKGATYCKSQPNPNPGVLGILCELIGQHVIEVRDGRLDDVGSPIVAIHGLDGLVDKLCGLPNPVPPVPGVVALVCSLVDQDVVAINDGRLAGVDTPIVAIHKPCG